MAPGLCRGFYQVRREDIRNRPYEKVRRATRRTAEAALFTDLSDLPGLAGPQLGEGRCPSLQVASGELTPKSVKSVKSVKSRESLAYP